MFEIDARACFVDLLSAFARAEDKLFDEILFLDPKLLHAGYKFFRFFFRMGHVVIVARGARQKQMAIFGKA